MAQQKTSLEHDDARDVSAQSRVSEKDQTARHALPHEQDQNHRSQAAHTEQRSMKQAYVDIQEGQVDTEARGTGGVDESNKEPGKRGSEAPKKNETGIPR